MKKFINYLKIEKGYSENTIKSYLFDLEKLNNFKKLEQIKTDDIINYFKKEKLKPVTQARELSAFNTYFKFLLIRDIIKINPCDKIDYPRIPKNIPDVLSVDEVNLLLDIDVVDFISARNAAILEILYGSGLRVSELINLKRNNIDFENNFIRIIGKGNKERIIPIGDYLSSAVLKYLEYRPVVNIDYLFLNNHKKQITRHGVLFLINKIATEKNIRPISPHTLRHSFATHMLINGADLRSIQEMLGHESISTTENYLTLKNDTIRRNYDNAHPHS